MPQSWVSPLSNTDVSGGVAGTTLSTAATLAISPSGAANPDILIPATPATYQGMMIRVHASGIYTCGATATNATFALMWGGTGGTTLCTSGALAMLINQTNVTWLLDALVSIRTVGTQGKAWSSGRVMGIVAAAPMSVSRMESSVFGAPALATINTTAAAALVLNGTLSQVVGAPSITLEQWDVEQVGV